MICWFAANDYLSFPLKSAPLPIFSTLSLHDALPISAIEAPLSAPPLPVNSRSAPPERETLPPVIDPPASRQVPVVGVRASARVNLFNAPVTLAVLPDITK